MTSWQTVKDYLALTVVALMRNQEQGELWLRELELCPDGQRLAVCMAIDLHSNAVSPEVFANVLDDLKLGWKDPREAFGEIVNGNNCNNYICLSGFYAEQNDDIYVRILELGDFIEFYLTDRGYSRTRAHVKRVRSMYFDPPSGVALSEVRRWIRGRMPNVWVMPFKDLISLTSGEPEGRRGDILYDALGLTGKNGVGGRNRPELIGVRYPEQFSIGCVQPTTLDAWWKEAGSYYLSYGKDDAWGRTHSLSGDLESQRERVHSLFKNLTRGYRTHYIGVVKKSPSTSSDRIIKEAYRRLEEVIKQSSV